MTHPEAGKPRDQLALRGPADPADLRDGFPRAKSLAGTWYRAHSSTHPQMKDRGCWWFASYVPPATGGGRFDLPHPNGTCYFADDIEAAVRERLGEPWAAHRYLTPVALAGTTVSQVNVSGHVKPGEIADTDHKGAVGYITRELEAAAPYSLSQQHAAAFADAGFEGILYRPRFTPGAARALALFGAAGRPQPAQLATPVLGWKSTLSSPLRRTATRRRAKIVSEPPQAPAPR